MLLSSKLHTQMLRKQRAATAEHVPLQVFAPNMRPHLVALLARSVAMAHLLGRLHD
ncbi:hypothetical protein N9L68_05730 [bacterium]|nr:hypothetical protein [bacterium]